MSRSQWKHRRAVMICSWFEKLNCIMVTAAASQSEPSLPVWSLPLLYQHWLWGSPVTFSVTLRLSQSLFQLPCEHRVWIMVVQCYAACMACAGGPTYFTTYTCAVIHYARSVACNQSQRGIASVAVRNRPADVDAGGSGAASSGLWAGPPKNAERRRYCPCPSSAGDRNSTLICIIYDFKLSLIDLFHIWLTL